MSSKVTILIAALSALLLVPLMSGEARAQKRVALVIGNGAYQSVAPLPNPIKDATAIADMFNEAGFDWVKMRQDLGNLEFKRALREFMDAAQHADIAVVYYAGHGIQIRDMNYMIPVDARLATEVDAEDEAVSLDRIVMAIEPAQRLRLVILDACRDNPFAQRMQRRVAMRAVSRGLARMEPTLGDTLIAYAAKAGSTAEDGDGDNSPFAAALIKNLTVPGLDIRLAFGRVRDEVVKRTGNKQEPFVYGSLGGEGIALVPASVPAPPKASVRAKVEEASDVKADYERAERIGTKQAWESFLSTHREGLYAGFARAQLAKLNATAPPGQPGPDVAPQAAPPRPPATNTPELILSAQRELRRLGCFTGEEDGKQGEATTNAVKRYLAQRGRSNSDIKVTESLVADLIDETRRVCPLSCARGEHAEGDRCVADAKPQAKPEKKATKRQRDEEERAASRAKAKREAKREERRRERVQQDEPLRGEGRKAAKRTPERAVSAPEPAARAPSSAPIPPLGFGILGVGGILGIGR
jgi:peptidoglycan hydrolase-like protein with peptidoglycan-binding domain